MDLRLMSANEVIYEIQAKFNGVMPDIWSNRIGHAARRH